MASVPWREITEALFTSTSITPYLALTSSIADFTSSSFLTSHLIGSAIPPAFSISLAAVWMVPGSLGWTSTVLESITTIAPSLAARNPIAKPIPRLAPEITITKFLRVLSSAGSNGKASLLI